MNRKINSFGAELLIALTLPSQLTWFNLMDHFAASKEATSGKHMLGANISSLLGFWFSPKISLQTSDQEGMAV